MSPSGPLDLGVVPAPASSQGRRRSGSALGVYFLILVSLVLLAIGLNLGSVDVAQYLFVLIVLALGTGAFMVIGAMGDRFGQFDPFEVGVWFSILVWFNLGLFGIVGVIDQTILILPFESNPFWLMAGLSVITLGMVAFWAAYALVGNLRGKIRVRHKVLPEQSDIQTIPERHAAGLIIVGMYTAIWAARMVRLRTIGVAYGGADVVGTDLVGVNQWSIYFDECSLLVVAIVAIEVFTGRWPKLALISIILAEAMFASLSGFTKPLLWLTMIVYMAARFTRWEGSWRIVAIGAAVMIFVVPLVGVYRVAISTGQVDTRSFASTGSVQLEAISTTWIANPDKVWDALMAKVVERQSQLIFAPALIVKLTPDVSPYLGWEQFAQVPLSLIPRALWPDKPVTSIGVWFGVVYFGADSATKSSAAITPFGELYLFDGWSTVVVGMAIYGAMLALLHRFLARPADRSTLFMRYSVYLAMIPFVTDSEASFTGLVQSLVQRLVVFGVMALVMYPAQQADEPKVRRATALLTRTKLPIAGRRTPAISRHEMTAP